MADEERIMQRQWANEILYTARDLGDTDASRILDVLRDSGSPYPTDDAEDAAAMEIRTLRLDLYLRPVSHPIRAPYQDPNAWYGDRDD